MKRRHWKKLLRARARIEKLDKELNTYKKIQSMFCQAGIDPYDPDMLSLNRTLGLLMDKRAKHKQKYLSLYRRLTM